MLDEAKDTPVTTPIDTVDAYIAAQAEASRATLERVRAAIRKAAPEATESISYGIPAYRAAGAVVIYFAGWKKHWSLYPATPAVIAGLGDALAPYEVEKGTIRFPLSEAVPARLVGRIVRIRLAEIDAQSARKAAGSGRRGKKRADD